MKRNKSLIHLNNASNTLLTQEQKNIFKKYIENKQERVLPEKDTKSVPFSDSTAGISGLDPHNDKIITRFQKDTVCIDSKYRDTSKYPNSNYFKSFLGKTFKNVVKIRLVSTQIPNVEEVIRNTPLEIQNNLISWQNEEDYNAGIKTLCPFIYFPNEKKLQITVINHGFTVGTIQLVKFYNSSIPNSINLIGERNVLVLDSNTFEVDYDALSNYSGTITVDIGIPIYTIEITPGSYSSIKLGQEIETKINNIKRSNDKFHYMKVDVNTKTDIITFSNYDIQKLLPNSISTILNSNIITVNQVNHSFKNGDIVFIENITKVGGIDTTALNGLKTVINSTNDTFQYEVNSNASQTTSGGGNSIIIGKEMGFRFLFDTENTLIQYNIGFPNEDSSEYIGYLNPITTNVLKVISMESNIPYGLTTITTQEDHLLNGNTFLKISDITTNSNPVYIITETNHNISNEIEVTINGLTTTPNINGTTISVIPLTENKLVIDSDTLLFSTNTTDYSNAYFYYGSDTVNLYNLIAHSDKPEYQYHLNIPVFSVISPTIFTIFNTYSYIDTNTINDTTVGTTKIKVSHTDHNFNNAIEMYTNGDLPIYNAYSSIYDSVNMKTKNTHDFSNRYKTDCIVVENGSETLASSSRVITGITIPITGTVKFELILPYYYTVGEQIIVSGTNALDGTYTITQVDYNITGPAPMDQYLVDAVYVSTDITDITFTGSPTLEPAFHQPNTLRIIFPYHYLNTNNTIKIYHPDNIAGNPDDTSRLDYLIEKISDHSFQIKYTHSVSFSDSDCSVLINSKQVEINNGVNIKPQLVGSNDFSNEYDIKASYGEIALGDSTYISSSNLSPSAYYSDCVTDETGQYVLITGNLLALRSYVQNLYPISYTPYYNNNILLYSNNYGATFVDINPYSIRTKVNGDNIQIVDNNGNANINENINYPITKLSTSAHSFLIPINHTNLISTTSNIKIKISPTINVNIEDCIIIDNDSAFNSSLRTITNIQNLTQMFRPSSYPPFIGTQHTYSITVNSNYYYIEGEQITISGTNIDGTYSIISSSNNQLTNNFWIRRNKNLTPTFSGSSSCVLTTHAINTVKVIIPYIDNFNTMAGCVMSTDGSYSYISYSQRPGSNFYKLLKINHNTNTFSEYITNQVKDSNLLNMQITTNSTGQYVSYIYKNIGNGKIYLYLSYDYGENFYFIKDFDDASSNAYSIKISETGQYQYIFYEKQGVPAADIKVYTSSDYGNNWVDKSFNLDYKFSSINKQYVDISNNGKYITVICNENFGSTNQVIFRSDNYGETFNLVNGSFPSEFINADPNLSTVSLDSIGRYQILGGDTYNLYSTDYGETWNYGGSLWGIGSGSSIKSTAFSKNGKYFYSLKYTIIDTDDGSPSQFFTNSLYKWNASGQIMTFQVEPSNHYYQKDDIITIQNNSDDFINGTYTILDTTSNTFDITPNKLIVPFTQEFNGTVSNNSRLNIIVSTNSYTQLGTNAILLENDSSFAFNIQSIQNENGYIKIVLDTEYYFNINEYIIISGTNSLDGTYEIKNVDYNPTPMYKSDTIYISSLITDLSYSGTATITPDFYDSNTVRIIYYNHNLIQGDTVFITNNGDSPSISSNSYYEIINVLSPHSFLLTSTPSILTPNSILLENYTNTSINISSINNPSGLTVRVNLAVNTYLNQGETIAINGTNGLDGVYVIDRVDYIPDPMSPVNAIYITAPSLPVNITYVGTPTITPQFYNSNTVRIIYESHGFFENQIIYLKDNGSSSLPETSYKIIDILSEHSFILSYTHPINTISLSNIYIIPELNVILQSKNNNLAILSRNQDIAFYRLSGETLTGTTNTIGGLSISVFNNRYLTVEKILNSNTYIIDCHVHAYEQVSGGGNNVYVSSLLHGIRKNQLNTYDGTSNTKLFRSISMEGYNYIFLVSSGVETKLDTVYNNSKINNVFAKILLNQPPGHMCFDSFISAEKLFYTPIPELSELLFAMYTPDGYLYNFNDTDYSLDLEVTTIVEELEESNISSKTRNKIKL